MMTAFAAGSISFRLYPHDLDSRAIVEELRLQARLACDSGFDGVMISERHGGIVGNMPNPIQVAGWLAEASTGWVAPCPVLIPLRPAALVVEELAWLSARFPARIGAGFGAGGHDLDYQMVGSDRDELVPRFEQALHFVVRHLTGRLDSEGPGDGDALAKDRAVAACTTAPVPVISAAMSVTAARRAARCGAGIIGSSLIAVSLERRLSEEYVSAGGIGPRVLIRHVWLGAPPREAIDTKLREYRRSASEAGRPLGADELIASFDAEEIAERVVTAARTAGKTCIHLRVHVPGISPGQAREQITAIGEQVVPIIRRQQHGQPVGV